MMKRFTRRTSPADVGPSHESSCVASAKKGANSFINYVNPKLVNFTKPLMLAFVIGGITFAAVIGIWISVWTQKTCFLSTITTRSDMMRFKEHVMSSDGFECIVDTTVTEIRASNCFDQVNLVGANWLNTDSLCPSAHNTADGCKKCFAQGIEECTVKSAFQTLDLGYGAVPDYPKVTAKFEYCKDSPLASKDMGDTMDTSSDGKVARKLQHCAYQNLQKEWVMENKAVTVNYRARTQLSMTAAIGAALGYQAYIELAITILVISLFLKIGIVETSDLANFKDLVMADAKSVTANLKTELEVKVNGAASPPQ